MRYQDTFLANGNMIYLDSEDAIVTRITQEILSLKFCATAYHITRTEFKIPEILI